METKKSKIIKVLLIIFVALLTLTAYIVQRPAKNKEIDGKIIRVIDGDSWEYLTDGDDVIRCRAFGVDAPESNQPFGKVTAAFLMNYAGIPAKIITHGQDKYKRTIAELFVNGECINLKMVKLGYAWNYKHFNSDEAYQKAENFAKSHKLGLWAGDNLIEPYEWRKTH